MQQPASNTTAETTIAASKTPSESITAIGPRSPSGQQVAKTVGSASPPNLQQTSDSSVLANKVAQSRCYLCETPKQDYSLIKTFTEIVCRGCVNYEGPDRVEQLISNARKFKNNNSAACGQPATTPVTPEDASAPARLPMQQTKPADTMLEVAPPPQTQQLLQPQLQPQTAPAQIRSTIKPAGRPPKNLSMSNKLTKTTETHHGDIQSLPASDLSKQRRSHAPEAPIQKQSSKHYGLNPLQISTSQPNNYYQPTQQQQQHQQLASPSNQQSNAASLMLRRLNNNKYQSNPCSLDHPDYNSLSARNQMDLVNAAKFEQQQRQFHSISQRPLNVVTAQQAAMASSSLSGSPNGRLMNASKSAPTALLPAYTQGGGSPYNLSLNQSPLYHPLQLSYCLGPAPPTLPAPPHALHPVAAAHHLQSAAAYHQHQQQLYQQQMSFNQGVGYLNGSPNGAINLPLDPRLKSGQVPGHAGTLSAGGQSPNEYAHNYAHPLGPNFRRLFQPNLDLHMHNLASGLLRQSPVTDTVNNNNYGSNSASPPPLENSATSQRLSLASQQQLLANQQHCQTNNQQIGNGGDLPSSDAPNLLGALTAKHNGLLTITSSKRSSDNSMTSRSHERSPRKQRLNSPHYQSGKRQCHDPDNQHGKHKRLVSDQQTQSTGSSQQQLSRESTKRSSSREDTEIEILEHITDKYLHNGGGKPANSGNSDNNHNRDKPGSQTLNRSQQNASSANSKQQTANLPAQLNSSAPISDNSKQQTVSVSEQQAGKRQQSPERHQQQQQERRQSQQMLSRSGLSSSHDELKCLTCSERLEDRHFVQCPSVSVHKFCFACSKKSITKQRLGKSQMSKQSSRLGDETDASIVKKKHLALANSLMNVTDPNNNIPVFCPSDMKCSLANETSPWTFMVSVACK